MGIRLPSRMRNGPTIWRVRGMVGVRRWHLENSGQSTHAVGSKMPVDSGLFDMLGNAIQCTFKTYDPSGDDLIRDGQASSSIAISCAHSKAGSIAFSEEAHSTTTPLLSVQPTEIGTARLFERTPSASG